MKNNMMKGISPLIAAVLLIAITVAIATLVSGWISTVTRTSQISAENKTSEAIDCAAASISIDQVYMVGNATDRGTVIVVARNSGQANDLQISNVTVINSTGGTFSFGTTTPVLQNFDRGNSYSFRIVNTSVAKFGTNCPNDFSKAIVTTNCGGVSAVYDKTPRC